MILQLQPTKLQERNATLDIIRGFSLLGILLVNIFAFFTPQPHIELSSWFTEARDIIWHQILDIYVQSSFYPLFSMLFGYGIALQFKKANEREQNFYVFASKRLFWLLIIGLLHAVFIWWGDILATYAICGIFLVLLVRFNGWVLIILGIIINAMIHMLYLITFKMTGIGQETVDSYPIDIMAVQQSITAYGTGTWTEVFTQRLGDLAIQMSPWAIIGSLFIVMPFMLIGAGLAKFQLIERAKQLKGLWITIAIVFTAGGLALKNLAYLREHTQTLDYLKVYIGGPILALGYIGVIVVICMIPVVQKLLSPVGKLGRMSLTMYIMQSIILSLLFYNFGFGLYGKVDVPLSVYISLAIYVVQLIIAELWFLKFRQGPLETVMKRLIYGNSLSEK